ncbi:MAG: hypothetical protein NVSMB17_11800 [Candidatus Dormibacteria bacterium]
MSGEEEQRAPGWRAVSEAMRRIHPGAPAPHHAATSRGEPRDTVVWAIDAYRGDGHWHLVTLGLTELWEKHSSDPDHSGWGFELTMKVPRDAAEDEPPGWAMNLLKVVGDSVFRTGQPLAEGSRLDIGAPVTGRLLSRLEALALTPDPDLPPITSPNGRVEFLLVVGITRGELEAMQSSSTAAVLAGIRADDPRLLTDPGR